MVRLDVQAAEAERQPAQISIPTWCDWMAGRNENRTTLAKISIPTWCDWMYGVSNGKYLFWLISIPTWCDWMASATTLPGQVTVYFNSYMVRLDGQRAR